MRAYLIGTVAAVVLALGVLPERAAAEWVYRTRYRWDPVCCRYVPYRVRFWVPDPCPVRVRSYVLVPWTHAYDPYGLYGPYGAPSFSGYFLFRR